MSHATSLLRICLAACLGCLGAATAIADDAADNIAPKTIELPEFAIVEKRELPEPESWRHGVLPGIEILSGIADDRTDRLMRELQRFRIAIGAVWPGALERASRPLLIVLCGRGADFGVFVPDNTGDSQRGAVSRFFVSQELGFVVIDASATMLSIEDPDRATAAIAAAGNEGEGDDLVLGANSDFTIDQYKELTRVYVRFVLSNTRPAPPPWLLEGLTQLISGVKYDKTTITFGEVENPNNPSAAQSNSGDRQDPAAQLATIGAESADSANRDRDFTGALGRRPLMPMDEFFQVGADDADARYTIGSRWAKQAYAFVHLCIYGERGRFQKGFFTFISRTQTEPVTETLFTECFGKTYREFESFLHRYVMSAAYKSVRFDLKNGALPDPEPLAMNEATQAEIGRIKGDGLRLARDDETAFNEMLLAYRRGERDPELLAAFGLVASARGDMARATPLLATAAAAKVTRPRAYVELAHLRFEAMTTAPAGTPSPRLSSTQLAAVLRPLFAARTQSPSLAQTYALIARAWEASATPPSKDNLAVLLEGAARFPEDSETLLRTARLHQAAGLHHEAAGVARLARVFCSSPEMTAAFVEIAAAAPANETPPVPAKPSR